MIILKCKNSDYLFKYKGNIELYITENCVYVSADDTVQSEDESLFIVTSHTWDRFFVEEVEWIKGE